MSSITKHNLNEFKKNNVYFTLEKTDNVEDGHPIWKHNKGTSGKTKSENQKINKISEEILTTLIQNSADATANFNIVRIIYEKPSLFQKLECPSVQLINRNGNGAEIVNYRTVLKNGPLHKQLTKLYQRIKQQKENEPPRKEEKRPQMTVNSRQPHLNRSKSNKQPRLNPSTRTSVPPISSEKNNVTTLRAHSQPGKQEDSSSEEKILKFKPNWVPADEFGNPVTNLHLRRITLDDIPSLDEKQV
jgi:hypothetical protein